MPFALDALYQEGTGGTLQEYSRYGLSMLDHWLLTLVWFVRISVGLACLVIGLIMLRSSRFKQHPYKLYGIELILLAAHLMSLYRLIVDYQLDEAFTGLVWFVHSMATFNFSQPGTV